MAIIKILITDEDSAKKFYQCGWIRLNEKVIVLPGIKKKIVEVTVGWDDENGSIPVMPKKD